ncbi:Gfo/Idh/MocA family protein [Paraburkholderia sacchari]|uniref:Gfo/Idh/MocA family protein n=1 Tax=Paraburkholderia sacchari TaxID=159450 RepID=UPI0005425D27|nr:Gfo/Idh/MocA family oxidoreductase [Paraburkholderia sacchari]NLP63963.1 Gfo/Idh/MocA family oxidoreductase [Paraburkholderia sacchari]
MSRPLRYGVIGAGMMGQEHLRNIALLPDAVVTALADPHAESIASARKIVGREVEVFADYRALLESQVCDVLVVATPNDTHRAVLDDILAAPTAFPTLIEKPICTTIEDCRHLADAASSHRAPLWVGMEYRYMPPLAAMIEEIDRGEVGNLKMFSIREHRHPFLTKVGNWNRFATRTGGTLVEKCCHFFDLMRFVLRDEAVRVFASGAADVNHRDERYDGQVPDMIDNAYVIVEFRSGRRASLDLCMFADGAYWQEEFSAVGDRGKIECLVPGAGKHWPGRGERQAELVTSPREPKGPVRRTVEVDEHLLGLGAHHGSTYFELLGFQQSILEGTPVKVSVEDGLKAVVIGLAAEQSIREGRAVELQGWTLR